VSLPEWVDRYSRIITILLHEGPLTAMQIATRAEMSYAHTWNVLAELRNEGIVLTSRHKRHKRYDIAGRGNAR
jgi:predicted transcriptional regulator